MSESRPTVLVVDDEPRNIEILLGFLGDSGYLTATAPDGLAAWQMLDADPARYDVVVLDRAMPRMSGLEVLQRMKEHPLLQSVPVILQTTVDERAEVVEGLRAGAYYYLKKPFEEDMLLSVLSTAVEDRMRYRRALQDSDAAGRAFGMLREATFTFRTLHAARDLAMVLASGYPDPRRVIIGLSELLINAVEHGNLAISYAEKTRLREQDRWEEEVQARLADPVNAHKQVLVRYTRCADCIRVTITDAGQGFDWQSYMDIAPSRAFDSHGRGIAMARMISFDRIEYRGRGNEVEVTVNTPAD